MSDQIIVVGSIFLLIYAIDWLYFSPLNGKMCCIKFKCMYSVNRESGVTTHLFPQLLQKLDEQT